MRTHRGKKHVADIWSPTKGVAMYRTSTGALVFHAHWSADPLKADPPDGSDGWADMVASEEPGGRHSVYFLQEFEADDEAKSGERIYWAYNRHRNVIKWREIPKDWPVYLGADFGQRNATAIEFLAQDPKSKCIYVFDSIYTAKGLDPAVKETIYRKLAKHFGIDMKTLMLEGAHRYIQLAEGDKTAAAFISFYQMDPWPINFAGRNDLKQHKNRATEAKVNRALWPSMTCCGVRHMADKEPDTDDEPVEVKKCPICGKDSITTPVLYLLEGVATELADQLEDLIDKEAAFEGMEIPEKGTGAPNHAADGLKYIIRAMDWEDSTGPTESEQEDREMSRLMAKQPFERTFEDSMKLRAYRAQQADDLARARKTMPRGISFSKYGTGRGIVFTSPHQKPRAQA